MSRPFLVKDIAEQAGVSTATVDRVLNGRPHVRAHMARRVHQAIAALERQRGQVGVVGRKLLVDLVMETPDRFAAEVRSALETPRPAAAHASRLPAADGASRHARRRGAAGAVGRPYRHAVQPAGVGARGRVGDGVTTGSPRGTHPLRERMGDPYAPDPA